MASTAVAAEKDVQAEMQRLRVELEQLRVCMEESKAQASELADECRRLQQELEHRDEQRKEAIALASSFKQALSLNLEARDSERTAEVSTANTILRDRETRLALALEQAGAITWEWPVPVAAPADVSAEIARSRRLRAESGASPLPPCFDNVPSRDRQRLQQAFADCLRGRIEELSVEYADRDPVKGERWMICRGRAITFGGNGECQLVGLSADITEFKETQTALRRSNARLSQRVADEVAAREETQQRLFRKQKLEALGQLTGGVAHDFNNLLAVVSNSAYLLQQIQEPERRGHLVERILTAVRRGSELTRRLLTFGRQQELRPQKLDVRNSLLEFYELLRPSLRRDIDVRLELDEDVWAVLADNGELQLAMLNLCVNARDAMPAGGSVLISAHNRAVDAVDAVQGDFKPGDYVALTVKDTGCGMSEEALQHAFEPFFTTKDIGEGAGLGLPQVYGFARQSGGIVQIRSHPGEGSELTILLPRACPVQTADAAPLPPGAQRCGASILVVEDDDALADLVVEMLQRWDHQVTRVSTGSAALQQLANGHEYDLLFTDVLLPAGMNGIDLARQARRRHPNMSVVLTTGFGGEPLRDAAAEGLTVLHKPYPLEALQRVISQALQSDSGPSARFH
jgi:signal transduction histidine kinase